MYPCKFKRFDKSIPALVKENRGNAGFDLYARVEQGEVTIQPGEIVNIPLNVATEIPTMSVGFVFQRSSLHRKWGLKLANGVGVLDSGYCGPEDEWSGDFQNITDKPVTVKHDDKLCQALFFALLPVAWEEVGELENPNRGGYGTTHDNAAEIQR